MLIPVLAFAMPIGHMHTYHSNAYTCKVHALSGFDPVFRTVASLAQVLVLHVLGR